MAAPEARRPIMDFVDEYSEELVCMMLVALEPEENKRKNSSQLVKYVDECVGMKFPGDDRLGRKAKEWPMADWAFDNVFSPRDSCDDEDEGAEQYYEMMDAFGWGGEWESSMASSSSSSSWRWEMAGA